MVYLAITEVFPTDSTIQKKPYTRILIAYNSRLREKVQTQVIQLVFSVIYVCSQQLLNLANLLNVSGILAKTVAESLLIHPHCQQISEHMPPDGGSVPLFTYIGSLSTFCQTNMKLLGPWEAKPSISLFLTA